MNTRKRGDQTEQAVDLLFSQYGIEPFAKTRGSGAVNNDGDRRSEEFMREDKYRGNKAFTIPHAEFMKAKQQALRQGLRLLFFVQNVDGQVVAVMPAEQFLPLLSNWLKKPDN